MIRTLRKTKPQTINCRKIRTSSDERQHTTNNIYTRTGRRPFSVPYYFYFQGCYLKFHGIINLKPNDANVTSRSRTGTLLASNYCTKLCRTFGRRLSSKQFSRRTDCRWFLQLYKRSRFVHRCRWVLTRFYPNLCNGI